MLASSCRACSSWAAHARRCRLAGAIIVWNKHAMHKAPHYQGATPGVDRENAPVQLTEQGLDLRVLLRGAGLGRGHVA